MGHWRGSVDRKFVQNGRGHPSRQPARQGVAQSGFRLFRRQIEKLTFRRGKVVAGKKVRRHADLASFEPGPMPVTGGVQHGRAAHTEVSPQQCARDADRLGVRRPHRQLHLLGDARQRRVEIIRKHERHERRSNRHERMPKLAGEREPGAVTSRLGQ